MYTHQKPLHLSPYDDPDIYPGPSPSSSFLYSHGMAYLLRGEAAPNRLTLIYKRKRISVEHFLELHGAVSIGERFPVLSYGSNTCLAQLKYKYSLNPDVGDIQICLKGQIRDTDVIYAACMTKYGAVPATLAPMEGAQCQVWLTYLDEQQLRHIFQTEGGYSLAVHKGKKLRLDNGLTPPQFYAYVYGKALTFDGSFHRFPDIPANESKARNIWEAHMLQLLSESFSLERKLFIQKVKTDSSFRRKVQEILNILSIPIVHPDWITTERLETWTEISQSGKK